MNIRLELMSQGNIMDIFKFEQDNKLFFEQTLPARPSVYNVFESFEQLMETFLYEQACGDHFMYLIRDVAGQMLGRINLFLEGQKLPNQAELGYRIGEKAQGKGVASSAVHLILEKAFQDLQLETIVAGTSTLNIGSQQVLIKNGFEEIAREKNVMVVNGLALDGILYAKYK